MKKYTNNILIITAIVVVLSLVIGYTIDFQTGYRSGRIRYEERNSDSSQVISFNDLGDLDTYVDSVETFHETSLQENESSSENQPETSHQ